MTKKSRSAFLEEAIELLVQHFGADQVSAAVAKFSIGGGTDRNEIGSPRKPSRRDPPSNPSITTTIERLRDENNPKYSIIEAFYTQLRDKKVLPESEDIRQFALLIGLKSMTGKSRKDLLPVLIRFLMEQPIDRLQMHIEKAADISGKRREDGFSVLTDKLVGSRPLRAEVLDKSERLIDKAQQ